MNQVVYCCRRVCLGAAFVLVMAGTGGLVGAIAGVMMVLLAHVVMGMSAGMLELLPGSVILGAVAAMSFGVFLMARNSIPSVWQPHLVSLRNREGEQMP